jgi:hypothetical protein
MAMVETDYEAREENLLTEIDQLKLQIKTFEEELGIRTRTVSIALSETEHKHPLLKRKEYTAPEFEPSLSMNKELSLPLKEAKTIAKLKPVHLEALAPQMGAKVNELPKMPNFLSVQPKPAAPVKTVEQRVTVKNISPTIATAAAKEPTPMHSKAPVRTLIVNTEVKKPRSGQSATTGTAMLATPQPVQNISVPIGYNAKDIPSLALLVKKLGELINANAAIAEDLREIISETRSSKKSARMSELFNKLAKVSSRNA